MRFYMLTFICLSWSIFTLSAKEIEVSLGITRVTTQGLTTIVTIQNKREKPFWIYGSSLTKPTIKLYTKNLKNNKWKIFKSSAKPTKSTFHKVEFDESFSVVITLPPNLSRRSLKIEYRSYYTPRHDSFVLTKTKEFTTVSSPPKM